MVAPRVRDAAVAFIGGFTVVVYQLPMSGQDSNPPKCWNAFGNEVACQGPKWASALTVAAVLLVIMWGWTAWHGRREARTHEHAGNARTPA